MNIHHHYGGLMKVNYRLQDVFENKLLRMMQKPVYLGLGSHSNECTSYIIIIIIYFFVLQKL